MAVLVVTYPAVDGGRFDGNYYVSTHMPLVEEKWRPLGLTGARALLPVGDSPAYAAIAVIDFRDGAAIDRALGSPEAAEIFGDIANFTDLEPVAQRCG